MELCASADDDGAIPGRLARLAAMADLLVTHPRLAQHAVPVRGERGIIGRPRDRSTALIAADPCSPAE